MAVQLQKDIALSVSDLFSEMLERVESDMAYHKILCGGFVMRETIIFEVERENGPLVCFFLQQPGKTNNMVGSNFMF